MLKHLNIYIKFKYSLQTALHNARAHDDVSKFCSKCSILTFYGSVVQENKYLDPQKEILTFGLM